MKYLGNGWKTATAAQKYVQIVGRRKKFTVAGLRSANNQLLEVPYNGF